MDRRRRDEEEKRGGGDLKQDEGRRSRGYSARSFVLGWEFCWCDVNM
jgi:hypothetical protein